MYMKLGGSNFALMTSFTGLLIGCGKKIGNCEALFKSHYAARKVYNAANYAISFKLI